MKIAIVIDIPSGQFSSKLDWKKLLHQSIKLIYAKNIYNSHAFFKTRIEYLGGQETEDLHQAKLQHLRLCTIPRIALKRIQR
jgi:predicted metal-dependent peptidase